MIYNLFTLQSCINFLIEFTGRKESDVVEFIKKQEKNPYCYDDVVERFIKKLNVDIDSVTADDIIIEGVHITTNSDECASIKKYGILNLQQVLTEDTPLRNFLRRRGYSFNFETNTVIRVTRVNGEIRREKSDIREYFNGRGCNLAATKLLSESHYPINAFLSIDSFDAYLGNIDKCPEIVRDISERLAEQWEEDTKSYAIKFCVKVHDCHCSTFMSSENEETEIKRFLLKTCIQSCVNFYNEQTQEENYLFLKSAVHVPLDNIYEIIDIDSNEIAYIKNS